MMTKDEVVREVELAAKASVWTRPDSVIIDRPGWFQVSTPSAPQFWMNGVIESILDEDEVEHRVDATIAAYAARAARFKWRIGARSRPSRLPRVLADRGLEEQPPSVGLAIDTAGFDAVAHSGGFLVEPVTPDNVDDYVAAAVMGWNAGPVDAQAMHADMRRSVADPAHATRYFVVRDASGTAVASGGVLPLARSGYLLGSSVVPEHRGRGAYRALVAARLDYLRRRGIGLATIHAMAATSAPICRGLGFVEVCELGLFLSP